MSSQPLPAIAGARAARAAAARITRRSAGVAPSRGAHAAGAGVAGVEPALRSGRSPGRGPRRSTAETGFSLVELLVALAVFATMAALAYGGLDSVMRTRAELGRRQAAFQGLMRSVASLERDLRQAAVRPVRGNYGESLPAFVGASDRVELTRIGFANPQAETRSNLERVFYAQDGDDLVRGAFPVLDRAPSSKPKLVTLRHDLRAFRLRYLDAGNDWSDSWPPPGAVADAQVPPLPHAVEFRIDSAEYGQITRIVELVSPWPDAAVEALAP